MNRPAVTGWFAPEGCEIEEIHTATYETPFGTIVLECVGGVLNSVTLGCSVPGAVSDPLPDSVRPFVKYLERYFEGQKPGDVTNRIDLSTRTDFELLTLKELAAVPMGRILSYGQLAERAGSPRAARAVGGAVGRNPVPIFIPCHRVIRADGGLGGFGAGTEWKTALLRHEGWTVADGKVEGWRAADG